MRPLTEKQRRAILIEQLNKCEKSLKIANERISELEYEITELEEKITECEEAKDEVESLEAECEALQNTNIDLVAKQNLSDLLDWDTLTYHERERIIAFVAIVKGYVTA